MSNLPNALCIWSAHRESDSSKDSTKPKASSAASLSLAIFEHQVAAPPLERSLVVDLER